MNALLGFFPNHQKVGIFLQLCNAGILLRHTLSELRRYGVKYEARRKPGLDCTLHTSTHLSDPNKDRKLIAQRNITTAFDFYIIDPSLFNE